MSVDPYYGGLWVPGGQGVWTTTLAAHQQLVSGVSTLPASWWPDEDHAWDRLTCSRYLPVVLATLGVINSWRTTTIAQVCAFTGSPRSRAVIRWAFRVGMVDIGVHVHGLSKTVDEDTYLVRPSASAVWRNKFLPSLSYPERVYLMGGRNVLGGSRTDRHNVLTTEASLRASTLLGVGAIAGEALSSADLLAGSGLGRKGMQSSGTWTADATWLRDDGLRIAVETQASSTPHLTQKVRRWGDLLNRRTLYSSGLVVLFVIAAPPDSSDSRRSSITKRIKESLDGWEDSSVDDAPHRIFTASWTDFFPAANQASPDFSSLTANSIAGDTVHLAGAQMDISGHLAGAVQTINTLAQSPAHLRGEGVNLWTRPLVDRGLTQPPAPLVAPAHHYTDSQYPSMTGQGRR